MTVSIIIAVKTWQKNLEECVGKCLRLDYHDFEIIILPDEGFSIPLSFKNSEDNGHFTKNDNDSCKMGDVPIFVIPTGPVSPAYKRDIGLKRSHGEVIAFLDDDAYPVRDWLKNAVRNFNDANTAGVGGPAVTPSSDNIKQKASGAVYSSILVSGKYVYRYLPRNKQEVDDYPSCNFLARKSVLMELGGFNTRFWPGEDTKLCLDITKKLGKKIIYDPQVLVYHHRRQLFMPHLRQIASYALHRGYFVKKYPETSLRLVYFIPTLFVLGVVFGAVLSVFFNALKIIYLLILSLYLFSVIAVSLRNQLSLIPCVLSGIITTHFTYGIFFIKGLLSPKLKEEEI